MKYLYRVLRLFFQPKCKHKWVIKQHIDKEYTINYKPHKTTTIYVLQCVHCGDIIHKEIE